MKTSEQPRKHEHKVGLRKWCLLYGWAIFLLKKQRDFDLFLRVRGISKSDFFESFYKWQRKITPWNSNRSYWTTFKSNIIYFWATALKYIPSAIFFFTCLELPCCFRLVSFSLRQDSTSEDTNLWRKKHFLNLGKKNRRP